MNETNDKEEPDRPPDQRRPPVEIESDARNEVQVLLQEIRAAVLARIRAMEEADSLEPFVASFGGSLDELRGTLVRALGNLTAGSVRLGIEPASAATPPTDDDPVARCARQSLVLGEQARKLNSLYASIEDMEEDLRRAEDAEAQTRIALESANKRVKELDGDFRRANRTKLTSQQEVEFLKAELSRYQVLERINGAGTAETANEKACKME